MRLRVENLKQEIVNATLSVSAKRAEILTRAYRESEGQAIEQVRAHAIGKVLRDEPLVADGYEGINGVTLCNAMYLSSWLDKTIELPLDEDLFLEELNQRRATSRRKDNVTEIVADLSGTYGNQ